jgi:hypothetical protein
MGAPNPSQKTPSKNPGILQLFIVTIFLGFLINSLSNSIHIPTISTIIGIAFCLALWILDRVIKLRANKQGFALGIFAVAVLAIVFIFTIVYPFLQGPSQQSNHKGSTPTPITPTATSTISPTASPNPHRQFDTSWVDSKVAGCVSTPDGKLQITTVNPYTQDEAYCFAPAPISQAINASSVPIEFCAQLQVIAASGPNDFRYGIVFRYQNSGNDWYYFSMHTDGAWSIILDSTFTKLVKGTIPNFDAFQLHVFCVQFVDTTDYKLYMDGNYLDSFSDSTLHNGSIGIFAIDSVKTSEVVASWYSLI